MSGSQPHLFCTLFDSNYLTRALVLYRSLEASGEDFILYAVCFDDLALRVLEKLRLPKLTAIPLGDFETPELLKVKPGRKPGEYCWTCTPHVIRHALDAYHLPEVTYLDADLCFYAGPSLLFAEFARSGASALITAHRYTPRYDQSATSGVYCVQFMTFKADARGSEALGWWQGKCLEWCYDRVEDGKFGDQKYLDDWTERFPGVHSLEHIGGGVAPWNVQQYELARVGGALRVDGVPLVFYHFQAYRRFTDGSHALGEYRLGRDVLELLYRPYARALEAAEAEAAAVWAGFDHGRRVKSPPDWKTPLRRLKLTLRGEFNEYPSL